MSQRKKARVFSLERILAGEGASALARELPLRRNNGLRIIKDYNLEAGHEYFC